MKFDSSEFMRVCEIVDGCEYALALMFNDEPDRAYEALVLLNERYAKMTGRHFLSGSEPEDREDFINACGESLDEYFGGGWEDEPVLVAFA